MNDGDANVPEGLSGAEIVSREGKRHPVVNRFDRVGPKFAPIPMYDARQQYQQQSVKTASPEKLIDKLYGAGIQACHQEDRDTLREVLLELVKALNMEQGGELAERLQSIYEFCINESATGDLDMICELLEELREGWRQGVIEGEPA
ncbi:flagellar export chaperone FliS [Salinibacter ruber]|uniref:flagellar export chaperone FliS n=1 Tax=Salinibacter ruber TaxID=146919 RepID=UPI002166D46D